MILLQHVQGKLHHTVCNSIKGEIKGVISCKTQQCYIQAEMPQWPGLHRQNLKTFAEQNSRTEKLNQTPPESCC